MASSRRFPTILFGLSAALWASPGLAQTGGTTATSTAATALATSDFITPILQRQDGNSWVDLATTDALTYLNQARCQCNTKVRILVQIADASRSKLATLTATTTGTNAKLYVGSNCAGLNSLNVPICPDSAILGKLDTGLSTLSANGSWAVQTTVGQIFSGAQLTCTDTLATSIVLWINTTGTIAPDLTGNSAPALGIKLDGTPPPAPSGVVVEGGNEALNVQWITEATDNPDLAGYLVFCVRGDSLQVFDPSYYGSQYQTGQILCSAAAPAATAATSSSAGQTTAVEVLAPSFFQNLDTNYLCSGLLSPSQTGIRLKILQNGIPYTVGVAAVDNSGNASPILSGFVQRPIPTINFYQEYRDAGGQSPGGYCTLAGRGARLGAISLLAGIGLLAPIVLRRRRRARRALSRGLPLLLLVLAAGSAQAQTVTHETTDEMPSEERESYRTPKEWAIEVRFGPFAPNIDSEFSGGIGATPYKTVFGGKRHLMSQLELDWQFLQAFGSLAAGVSIGYYSQSAKAFTANAAGGCVLDTTGVCTRSGDTTTLRLVPMAALLVYRLDAAAERWSVPLVPYAKLGLNYTFWQIHDGNGDVPDYKGGHGSGGTPGWQAAAGMSLLLDFLDPSAARGLDMETGVNHSYLFFEWDRVEATGLGMTNKLHVGDSRWVIGLMFEF